MGVLTKIYDAEILNGKSISIKSVEYSSKPNVSSLKTCEDRQRDRARRESSLVNEYFDDLIVFLRGKNLSGEMLDDVVQDTWLVVLQKSRNNEVRDLTRIKSFIFSVASNQLIMAYRKKQKRTFDELSENPTEPGYLEPDKILESKQLVQKISNTIGRMSQLRDQDVLLSSVLTSAAKNELTKKYEISPEHYDRVRHRSKIRFINAWESASN